MNNDQKTAQNYFCDQSKLSLLRVGLNNKNINGEKLWILMLKHV